MNSLRHVNTVRESKARQTMPDKRQTTSGKRQAVRVESQVNVKWQGARQAAPHKTVNGTHLQVEGNVLDPEERVVGVAKHELVIVRGGFGRGVLKLGLLSSAHTLFIEENKRCQG
jgi:hypothetical protein